MLAPKAHVTLSAVVGVLLTEVAKQLAAAAEVVGAEVVDDAIDLYKKANGIADDELLFVVKDLVTHRGVNW